MGEIRKELNWDIGDEINWFLHPGYVILKEREGQRRPFKKARLIVDEVAGSARVPDPKIIDQIINETEFKE